MAVTDPIATVLLALAVILVVSRLGGDLAARIGQPPVLGELLAGVVIGNLQLAHFGGLEFLRQDAVVDALARLGVILLLFQVGLESSVRQLMRVGISSLLVATLGVVTPFALGWAAGALLVPEAGAYGHAFLAATLCATSVGITARVLKDLGATQSVEARIILGAAVIDDVFGLVILAVVAGAIGAAGGSSGFGRLAVLRILVKATLFLAGSLLAGAWLSPRVFARAARLKAPGVLLAFGLAFCFAFSWLAGRVSLAPIVGAFAAGLILETVHFQGFRERGEHDLEGLVEPLVSFLAPVFFVLMGMRTDLRVFAEPRVPALAGALVVAAVAGKQASSLGVVGRGIDRITIGLGMIPRGEVGLIFASLGLQLTLDGKPVLGPAIYSAVVVMVIVTTLITPPALRWRLARRGRAG